MRRPFGTARRGARLTARAIGLAANAALLLSPHRPAAAQAPARTLVAVFAHGDDEGMVAPILARYAREGVQVYLVVATDGAQGGRHTTIPRGPELAGARAQEARCATDALGIRPPILLGFPDAKLGDYAADPSLVYRLAQRVHEELQRLRPDAVITFGPDGATGHPDHRLVGDVVTQLVRAGAPGLPDRLFYGMIPAEGMQAMNPQRGAPPLLVPQAKYLSVKVPFAEADLEAARRSMSCHGTQYAEEVVQRVFPSQARAWNGSVPLAPAFSTAPGTDLFR
jgi:LmbE family N-acetylglucosaminyl deacetylase